MSTKKAIPSFFLCGASSITSDIAEKQEEKQCLDSVSHLKKLQKGGVPLAGLFLRLWFSICETRSLQNNLSPSPHYPEASWLSIWVWRGAFRLAKKSVLKSPLLKPRGW